MSSLFLRETARVRQRELRKCSIFSRFEKFLRKAFFFFLFFSETSFFSPMTCFEFSVRRSTRRAIADAFSRLSGFLRLLPGLLRERRDDRPIFVDNFSIFHVMEAKSDESVKNEMEFQSWVCGASCGFCAFRESFDFPRT